MYNIANHRRAAATRVPSITERHLKGKMKLTRKNNRKQEQKEEEDGKAATAAKEYEKTTATLIIYFSMNFRCWVFSCSCLTKHTACHSISSIQMKSNRNFIKLFLRSSLFAIASCDSYREDVCVFLFLLVSLALPPSLSLLAWYFANVSIHKIFHSCSMHVTEPLFAVTAIAVALKWKRNTSLLLLLLCSLGIVVSVGRIIHLSSM